MTDKMNQLSVGEWLAKQASHMLGNGIQAYLVLGLWYDHDPCDAEIEEMVSMVQVGPGFTLDGLDEDRRVMQLSSITGFEDTHEANAYLNDWLDELSDKPLAEIAVLRFKMAWTEEEHAEFPNRSQIQFIDQEFLHDPYWLKDSES